MMPGINKTANNMYNDKFSHLERISVLHANTR